MNILKIWFMIPVMALILTCVAVSSWADTCRDMDMYGIYKVCGPALESHQKHQRPDDPAIYVTAISEPVMASPPVITPVSAPPVADPSRRELTAVEEQLHRLHLLLSEKQTRSEITMNFFDEETRYLDEIERHLQTYADTNGGYITLRQESSFLERLQVVENEILRNSSNNG